MSIIVNGEPVNEEEIRLEVQRLRPAYYERIGPGDPIAHEMQLREWSKENVIERLLLRQEALRDPEPIPAEELAQPGASEADLRLRRLLAKVTSKIKPPRYAEVGDFYKRHKEDFRMPEVIRAAHILKNVDETHPEEEARAAIEAIEQELKNGADFAALADRSSDCPGNGGDLGWFPRGTMVPEFDEQVFALSPGQTTGIFRTAFGFHIARVLGRRPAGIPGLMEVREQIEQSMWQEKQQRAIEQFVDGLRARAEIKG